jgi:TPR repeat protein
VSVKVRGRRGTYRYLAVGLLTFLISTSLAVTAYTGQLEDADAAIERGDYEEAYRLTKPLAQEGIPEAQFNLGLMYALGQGVPQDETEAAKWFRKAAEQGDPFAQSGIGLMYYEGQGVPQDYAEAVKWWRMSEEHDGNPPHTTFLLGSMYYQGAGVPQDYAEAAKWYQKAADRGDSDAQNNLGNMYENGQGVPQDYTEAVKWYRKAADQGNPYAQLSLGIMFFYGNGVPQDYVLAHMWTNLGVLRIPSDETKKRKQAIRMRDTVAGLLTPAQIAEAQRMAREWKPKKEVK